MIKASAFVLAGAVLASVGTANAQELQPADPGASGSAVPWYQRFTTSSGVTESITGDGENDRALSPTWNVNQRWEVTLDVREAQRIERSPEGGRGDQASVGAFYQFTPNMRLGGEVSVEAPERPAAGLTPALEQAEADVRIESAFRF